MNRPLLILIVAVAAFVFGVMVAGSAGAQVVGTICGMRADVATDLLKDHGERPVSFGIIANSVLETFVNKKTGTFTITVTRPDGVACIMAAGGGWQDMGPLPEAKQPKDGA